MITCGPILKRFVHLACFANVPIVIYGIPKDEEDDDEGEILGGTGYDGRWGRVFLFSKSTQSNDMETTENSSSV